VHRRLQKAIGAEADWQSDEDAPRVWHLKYDEQNERDNRDAQAQPPPECSSAAFCWPDVAHAGRIGGRHLSILRVSRGTKYFYTVVYTFRITGITADSGGTVTISDAAMTEIRRFDLGTQATVRLVGANDTGGSYHVVRIVQLNPDAPW